MYDPKVGRWLSEDPIWPESDINPYRYVHNGPTKATDPSGLWEVDATLEEVRKKQAGDVADYWNDRHGVWAAHQNGIFTVNVKAGWVEEGHDSLLPRVVLTPSIRIRDDWSDAQAADALINAVTKGPFEDDFHDYLKDKQLLKTKESPISAHKPRDPVKTDNEMERLYRNILIKQVEEWQMQQWHFPAKLLQHFLDKKGGTIQSTPQDVAEVMPRAEAVARALINREIGPTVYKNRKTPEKIGEIAIKDALVRRYPSGSYLGATLGTFGAVGSRIPTGEILGADDFMFVSFFGARMSVRGTVTNIRTNPLSGEVLYDANVKVEITDHFDFPPGTLDYRNISTVYAAGNYLNKTLNYPEPTVKLTFTATYKDLSFRNAYDAFDYYMDLPHCR